VVLKLLPRPERAETLVFAGLSDDMALKLMAAALGSPHEVSAAAHLPAAISPEGARTCLRIEGLAHAVEVRLAALRRELADFGAGETVGPDETERLWAAIRDAVPVSAPAEREVWRVSVAAAKAVRLMAGLPDAEGRVHFYDWGGGLIWIASASDISAPLREIAGRLGGHATLIRASAARRASIPVFQPLSGAVMTLTDGVKRSFDPDGLINPGRMYEGI
jgi:glycolate oxidase FAD binding subunit